MNKSLLNYFDYTAVAGNRMVELANRLPPPPPPLVGWLHLLQLTMDLQSFSNRTYLMRFYVGALLFEFFDGIGVFARGLIQILNAFVYFVLNFKSV